MSNFKLQFDCDNAAFCDEGAFVPFEASKILRSVATCLDEGVKAGFIRDSNGNKVGHWELELDSHFGK